MKQVLRGLTAFAAGAVFGVGLLVSGMSKPEKVLGFLDVTGRWDASLTFVMAGAIGVHFIAYRLIRGRASPLLDAKWALPTRRDIDFKLVLGAAVFGLGWGLGGYCPGPALVSLGSGAAGAVVFTAAMLLGMVAASRVERLRARADQAQVSVNGMNPR
jgi:uncharacterized membrane protein YedE/YeeE